MVATSRDAGGRIFATDRRDGVRDLD